MVVNVPAAALHELLVTGYKHVYSINGLANDTRIYNTVLICKSPVGLGTGYKSFGFLRVRKVVTKSWLLIDAALA